MRRKFIFLMSFVLILSVSSVPASGHGIDGHRNDWLGCLGIKDDPMHNAENVWECAQEIIDGMGHTLFLTSGMLIKRCGAIFPGSDLRMIKTNTECTACCSTGFIKMI